MEVEVAAAEPVGAAGADRAGWVAQQPRDLVATVYAPVAGTAKRMWPACLATRKSARNAAQRWRAEIDPKRKVGITCLEEVRL